MSGIIGGWIDLLPMRVIDVMMGFPSVLLALIVVAVPGLGAANVMVAVGASLVPTLVRLVRGDVLVVREQAFVAAALALGRAEGRLALRHLLPNILAPVIVLATSPPPGRSSWEPR